MIRRAVVVLGVFAVHAAAQQADSLERERIALGLGTTLDSAMTAHEKEGFAGAVLVVRNRQILLLKGYGFADKERRISNTPATRYELNSLTKMFTAASILQLADAGRLDLDAPIGRYLGAFPKPKQAATVRQLASHTAGLVRAGTALAGDSREAFIRDVKATPIESEPGTKYRYTNAGYSVLAAIVEVVSGRSFPDYLREHVFAPAGMRSARFRDAVPAADPLFAHGYAPPGSGATDPYRWSTVGAGGVWSTIGDVYRYVVAVDDGRIIPPRFAAMMRSAPPPPSLEAFGWHVYPGTDSTRFRIEKGGGSPDFATQLLEFPRDGVVIIWASNDLTRRWRPTLNQELPRIVFGGK